MRDGNVQDITAFILAGGKSSRMGSDKAFLELASSTLLERSLALAHALAAEVFIVGSQEKFSRFGRVVEDVFRDCGPLAGIHAALTASRTDLNLALAVDLPFLEVKFLEYLISQARMTSALATVPRAAGGWQPLCAVYRREFAASAESALQQGKNKIDLLFSQVEVNTLEEDELLRHGFKPEMFRNLNTPEEMERARKRQ